MRTPFIALLGALALAGCQASTGSSTYGGGLGHEGVSAAAATKSATVRRKVGKVRRTARDGSVYYVNKYERVPAETAKRSKRTKRVTAAYAPRKSVRRVAKAIRKAAGPLKASTKAKGATKHNGAAKVSNKKLDALIAKHARANGVPVKLARAVVKIESGGRVNARGAAGEIGLMQLMPRTARGIGYKGKMKALYNPDTNLAYGMKYLGEAYRRGGKTPCGAVLKYNAGHYAKRWNPVSRKYCKRVKAILKKG